MEVVGSRSGRTSSRFLTSSPTTAFTGPVRKWKKKWVHVSQSPNTTFLKSRSQFNKDSSLLLCKWTPNNSNSTAEPRKRKFRYTPIAALISQNKEGGKLDSNEDETCGINQSTANPASESDDIYLKEMFDFSVIDTQTSKRGPSAEEDARRIWSDLGLL